ncbi:MAG: hypothetical protein JNG84_03205, partial [Archangium sp.]|nr:hypothetical protein [Archangium sp.]
MRWLAALGALVLHAACQCGGPRLTGIDEEDAGAPLVDAGPMACATGSVSGRVCATDRRTWLNGAAVSVAGSDCN